MKHIPPQQLQSYFADEANETVIHVPVLLKEAVRLLAPKTGDTYLDLTAGYGGHASKVIEVIGAAQATLVDRDEQAIASLQPYGEQGARLIRSDFASAAQHLAEADEAFDMVLVDLGVSSPQLDEAERGFSIKRNGPLDMRMDRSGTRTATDIVNRMSERDLARIVHDYGEESHAKAARIAKAIRTNRPITSTSQLADVIMRTHRGPYQKVHPATRTFQAIRIELNDELGQIERLLPLLPRLVKQGGRVVIISFHSLEDRLVKRYFSDQDRSGYEAELRLLVKKPILGAEHDTTNPRARSAILRAAVKQ